VQILYGDPDALTFLVSKVMRQARVGGGVVFRLIHDDRGVTAVEYTLIAALTRWLS
jgi:hypothetical protein